MASLHSQPIYPKMCSIDDIIDNLQLVGWNLKGGLFDPGFGGYADMGSGIGPFSSPPMGSYLLHIDIYGLSLTVIELFSWLQEHLRPPDPDTMKNSALEAINSVSVAL